MKTNGNGKSLDYSDKDRSRIPAYGMPEVTRYLRLPRQTVEYWIADDRPLTRLDQRNPPLFTFMNLLECHVISAMKAKRIRLEFIRMTVETMQTIQPTRYPLIENVFHTNGRTVFYDTMEQLLDVGRGGQQVFREFFDGFLERIEIHADGRTTFFPFVQTKLPNEPKYIQIDPLVSFGRPVIAGTGISTSMIASRWAARESIPDLAKEYGRTIPEIEEAIRWEGRIVA